MATRASKSPAVVGLPDVHMAPHFNDTITDSPRPGTTLKNGKFQLWERHSYARVTMLEVNLS